MHNLQDIIETIHQQTGIHPVTCRVVARRLFEEIRATLQRQEEVEIESFGRFTFKHRKATIHKNVNGGPDTFSPSNDKLVFKPDVHWENWQRVHSSQIPDNLPDGTKLGTRLSGSSRVHQEFPHLTTPNTDPFFLNVIVPRAIRRSKKDTTQP